MGKAGAAWRKGKVRLYAFNESGAQLTRQQSRAQHQQGVDPELDLHDCTELALTAAARYVLAVPAVEDERLGNDGNPVIKLRFKRVFNGAGTVVANGDETSCHAHGLRVETGLVVAVWRPRANLLRRPTRAYSSARRHRNMRDQPCRREGLTLPPWRLYCINGTEM